MLIYWHHRALFSIFTETAKSMLTLTMSAAVEVAKAAGRNFPTAGEISSDNLTQPSFLSSLHDPAMNSYVTISSIPNIIVPYQNPSGKKKKNRRRAYVAANQIPYVDKSIEFRSIEAFLAMNQYVSVDDMDLISGGEDPVILHAVIHCHSTITSYKEVYKFRRRPQFLEYLVHLSSVALSKGHGDKVMEWLGEAFLWFSKRNEIILSQPKGLIELSSTTKAKGGLKVPCAASVSSKVTPVSKSHSQKTSQSISRQPSRLACDTSSKQVKSKKRLDVSTNQQSQVTLKDQPTRRFNTGKAVIPPRVVEVSQRVKITREDLEAKSIAIISTQLLEMWRQHKCRYMGTCCMHYMSYYAHSH